MGFLFVKVEDLNSFSDEIKRDFKKARSMVEKTMGEIENLLVAENFAIPKIRFIEGADIGGFCLLHSLFIFGDFPG